MSDAELRLAEREWKLAEADTRERAFEDYNRARERSGLPRVCHNCRVRERACGELALAYQSNLATVQCLPCLEDGLRHGHRMGLHDEHDPQSGPLPLCPLCQARCRCGLPDCADA